MKTLCNDLRRTRNGVGRPFESIAPTVGLSLAATAAPSSPCANPGRPKPAKRFSFTRMAILVAGLAMLAGPGRALAQRPLGVDVSSYQGSINWSSAKGAGITFAWAKATEGTGYIDGYFTANQNNGKNAGVYMGAYHFPHPELNTPAAEAAYFWNVAGGYVKADGKTLMPMIDIEGNAFTGNVGASSISDWVNQWCADVVQDAANNGVIIKPVIYVSACNAGHFNSTVTQWYPWIADWSGSSQSGTPWSTCGGDDVWGTWVVWQYTDAASVSGISGNVDGDVFNGSAATLASTMLATASSSSKIYYWDPQGSNSQNPYTGSMTGTWENNDWSYGSSGMASPVGWTDGKAVCFGVNTGNGTPAYTVTMNSSHVVAGFFDGPLNPNSCDVTITGSGIINLASGAQALDSIINADGSVGYLRINCVIAGDGELFPEGNGQSFLHGANTYTGGTQLGYDDANGPNRFNGIVNFNNGSAFGTGTITLWTYGNGGALVLEGSSAVTVPNPLSVTSAATNNIVGNAAGLTFSGNWSLGGNLLTLGAGGTAGNQTIISGAVSGTAGLTVYNSGTVVLSGVNTYSGTTSINSPAVLTIGGAGQLGSGSYSSSIVNNGTFNYNSTAPQTLSGVISGSGPLALGGSGTLTLSAANTYTGATTINSGATLQLGAANSVPSASSVFVANGATFDLNGYSPSVATLSAPLGATSAAGNVINNNGTLTINGTSTLDAGESGSSAYSGVISGSGNLAVTGGGSTTLSGANTYGGTTTVSGGTLVPAYNGALPSASAVTVNSPGVFDIVSVNDTIASLAGSGTVNLGSGTLTVSGSTSTAYSGVIQGAPGEVYVANSSSQPGLWGYYYNAVNPGFTGTPIMRLDTTVNFSDLTTQQPSGVNSTQFSARWVGRVLTTSSAGSYTFTTTSDDGTRCWVNGQLVVDNWAYQGATARSGTIILAANTYYDIRLEYEQGVGGASCVLAWTPPGGSSAVIPSSNLSTYAGYGGLVKNGSSTLTLAGANTYKGATSISGGALSISADNNLGTAPNSATAGQLVINGGTLATTSSFAPNANRGVALGSASGSGSGGIDVASGTTLTYGGIIANNGGVGGLTKTDTGTLALSGANTYSGGTTIIAGTLEVSGFIVGNVNNTGGVLKLDRATALASGATLTLASVPSTGAVNLNFSGTQTISALYFGTTQQAAGTWAASGATFNNAAFTGSGVLNVTTGPASTTVVSLTSGSNPSTYDESLTFTATVTGNSPSGTVQFKVDGVAAGNPLTLSGGSAAFTTSALTVLGSPHQITASYSGDANNNPSTTASAVSQTITPATLTVTGIGASNKVYDGTTAATLTGTPGTLVGVVSGDTVTLSGTAAGTFADPNVGTGKTVTVSGQTLTGASAGNYTLTEPTTTASITAAASMTALVSSQNPSSLGSNVTFTATVSAGVGTPAGNVVFLANAVPFSTNALAGGVAAASTSALPSGTNAVAALYAPQGNYLASTGTVQQVVQGTVVSQTNTISSIVNNGNGTLTLHFIGTPQAQYYVVASPVLAVPTSAWAPLPGSTNTVTDPNGLWSCTVTNAANEQFYRSVAVAPSP